MGRTERERVKGIELGWLNSLLYEYGVKFDMNEMYDEVRPQLPLLPA